MTKAELLQSLATKFYIVMPENAMGNPIGNVQYYLVKVFDKNGDDLRDMQVAFFVENEGGAGETAFWSPAEPKPTPVIGFQAKVNTYIATKITDGTIEGAYIENIDNINETAMAKVVKTDLAVIQVFLDKDGNGDLRYRLII